MTRASDATILRRFVLGVLLFVCFWPVSALAGPDLRVFVVDASMFALIDEAKRRETFDLIASDIRALSADPENAPSRGSALVFQGRSSIDVFAVEKSKGELDAGKSTGLTAAVDRAVAGGVAGGLDLVALRDTLLRILSDHSLVAPGQNHSVELHVFAAEWRTGAGPEHRISAYDRETAAIAASRRPTQCFVEDVGAAGASRSPWPLNVTLGIELRPPHHLPTPSQEALADLAAVLALRASDAPFFRSLGIAGPLCPPGETGAFRFTGLADPAECARAETASQSAVSVDVCRSNAPVLPATDASLVRRPLNVVIVDGDAAASALEASFPGPKPAFAAALFIGAEPVEPSAADLRGLTGAGREAPLRVSLQRPATACAGPEPFSAEFDLGQTRASFVTAPIDCGAFGPSGDMTFELFDVKVN